MVEIDQGLLQLFGMVTLYMIDVHTTDCFIFLSCQTWSLVSLSYFRFVSLVWLVSMSYRLPAIAFQIPILLCFGNYNT